MKQDVRKIMKIISGDGRKHFRISQPEATEDSKNTRYSTFPEQQTSYRVTAEKGTGG